MARIPKYRRRSGRDRAFVEVDGKRIILPGPFGSKESREAYAEIIRSIAQQTPLPRPGGLTVAELVISYLDHAAGYYDRKEYLGCKMAAEHLIEVAGDTLAANFGPLLLDRVRHAMLARSANYDREPWARTYINKQINRLRRFFRWGTSKELVPASVQTSLSSLMPLRKGKTTAHETVPVQPVAWKNVEITLAHCQAVLDAMIRLQWLTGMRSQNLVAIRPADIDRTGDVWIYRPPRHKTDYLGSDLIVFLGPRAQQVLLPFLDRSPDAACFSPRESEAARNASRRRPGRIAQRYGRQRNSQYTTDTYRQAVQYAIDRANATALAVAIETGAEPPPALPQWFPYQLRHSRATEIRPQFGLEGAQVFLGHASADVTQVYAERDMELGKRIARETG